MITLNKKAEVISEETVSWILIIAVSIAAGYALKLIFFPG